MPLIINREVPKDKEIVMGGNKEPVADYYPPGVTEPIVRPSNVPDPAAKTGAETVSEESPAKQGPVGAPEKEAPKAASKKK